MPLVESSLSLVERDQEMLRIEKESDGCVTQLLRRKRATKPLGQGQEDLRTFTYAIRQSIVILAL